jgi:hypothetical protein
MSNIIKNIKNNNAHGVTKIFFLMLPKLWQIFEFFNFPGKLATNFEVYV